MPKKCQKWPESVIKHGGVLKKIKLLFLSEDAFK